MSFTFGTLVVPNETNLAFGAVISATDGSILQNHLTLGTGEQGASLPDGTFCVATQGATAIASVQIFNPSLTLRASAVPFTETSPNWNTNCGITSNFVDTFYASKNDLSALSVVKSFDANGTVGGTSWTIEPSGSGVIALGLTTDAAHFIYVIPNVNNAAIKLWTLATDLTGGTIVGGVATTKFGHDILVVPSDGSFLIFAKATGPVLTVRRYTAAGSLVTSYPLDAAADAGSPPRLSMDLGDPSGSFWIRTFPDFTHSTFARISLTDGSTIQSFTVPSNSGDPSQVPFSCPFFAWSVPPSVSLHPPWPLVPPFVAGVGGLETVAQRRVRVAPHLSAEQFNIFYDQFTLDLQVGNGILTGQGVNPQIMLRMSDDGGYTWSDEILLDSGAQGQYLTRVTANGLGQARDRVFEISTSDPVSWSIISAYLNTRKGRW